MDYKGPVILIDSREQLPYSFKGMVPVTHIKTCTLNIGDYSIEGHETELAIERKSLDDLIGCLMGPNRDRFERELAKGRAYDFFAVVVEADMADVLEGQYRSDMKPQSALQSIVAFQVRYRVPFVWAGDRKGGEYMTHSFLSKYLREIGERYKVGVKGQEAASSFMSREQVEEMAVVDFTGKVAQNSQEVGEMARREHIASPDCWCEPVQDHIEPDVFIHRERH